MRHFKPSWMEYFFLMKFLLSQFSLLQLCPILVLIIFSHYCISQLLLHNKLL